MTTTIPVAADPAKINYPQWLFWIFVALYVGIAASQRNAPLRGDEIEWPPQVRAILERGRPAVLITEDNFIRSEKELGYPVHYGLWHPPLYLYLLSGYGRLFGTSDSSLRLFGLATGVLTLFALRKLIGHCSPSSNGWPSALGVGLCAINPYFISGTLLLDIDNTVLMALLMWLLYFAIKLDPAQKWSAAQTVSMGLLFGLCLLAKFTTPPLVLLGVIIASLVLGSVKRVFLNMASVGLVGVIAFSSVWFGVAARLQLPAAFPFQFTVSSKMSRFGFGHGFTPLWSALPRFALWATVPLFVLAIAGAAVSLKAARVNGTKIPVRNQVYLTSVALIVACMYFFWVPSIGKYTVMLVPIMSLLASANITNLVSDAMDRRPTQVLALFSICGLSAVLVGDLWYAPPFVGRPHVEGLPPLVTDVRFIRIATLLVATATLAFACRVLLSLNSLKGLLVACVALAPASALTQDWLNVRAQYSPFTPFKEPGLRETAAFVRDSYLQGKISGVVAAPKDIGYYIGQPIMTVATDEADPFDLLKRQTGIGAYIESDLYPNWRCSPSAHASLVAGFPHRTKVGAFVIYAR